MSKPETMTKLEFRIFEAPGRIGLASNFEFRDSDFDTDL